MKTKLTIILFVTGMMIGTLWFFPNGLNPKPYQMSLEMYMVGAVVVFTLVGLGFFLWTRPGGDC